MAVTVYGSSDDLIEVEGDVLEEFYLPTEGDSLLAFSTGVVLRIDYTEDGVWRITPLAGGSDVTLTPAEGPDSDNYSDRAELVGPVGWVVLGSAWKRGGGV